MKVSKGKSKQARSKGSQIALSNEARMKAAGRKGTKNFVDPNKVFVGNLSYDATESDLRDFLLHTCGVLETNIEAIKIIRDWRTKKSKGYGFIQFMAPIYASSALELIKGKKLLGRVVRLDQGKKKKQDPIVVVKEMSEKPLDTEEEVIANALKEVEVDSENIEQQSEMDNLLEQQQVLEDGFYLDPYDDSALFDDDDDDDDDDDFQYDGFYVEEFLPDEDDGEDDQGPLNREQRREAAKAKKKRRKPGKGFGNITPATD